MNMKHVLISIRWSALALASAVWLSGCGSAPPAPTKPVIRYEQKLAWILQLEDQRLLRIEPVAPVAPPVVPGRRRAVLPVAPPPAPPDLVTLVADTEARVRRRAALAIGRVGLREGVPPLVIALGDPDPEVREMAAFALGLIADPSAVAPLTTALTDTAPLVRGRAAEALGLIAAKDAAGLAAAKDAAAAVGRMAAEYAGRPAVAAMTPDEETSAAPEAQAFRLGLCALVRLHAYEPLASAALDGSGRPVTNWWPVAYALQRINDRRAAPALVQLLGTPGKYTASFAARGLGALKDASFVESLLPLAAAPQTPLEVRISVIRALAELGDPRAAEPLVRIASDGQADPNLRLEAVSALGTLRLASGLPIVQDLMSDAWPAMRIAALRAAAAIDPESFLLVLSGLDPDPQWSVRAALAGLVGTLPLDIAVPRLEAMLHDEDQRVLPSVLNALVRVRAPDAAAAVMARVKEPDFVVRATVAHLIGQLQPAGGAEALKELYRMSRADAAYDARAAALAALAEYGPAAATETVKDALTDRNWPMRLRAVALLAKLDPAGDYRLAVRPAPPTALGSYDDPLLISPAYSPHVFIETAKGTIEIELAVLDAPATSRNFMALARKGFFNGLQIHRVVPNFVVQDGDPRGDGEGGPGYTIRDELNERPFVRGTVGMALAGPDTGGSQFFIAHSPQPHLDAKYTVFGQVVNGMSVVDRIQQRDVIQRVRVWDGKTMQ
jgi:cyclophilin family peptidyl-prolyl cis-trans isomerase/HEAT repeat protein